MIVAVFAASEYNQEFYSKAIKEIETCNYDAESQEDIGAKDIRHN